MLIALLSTAECRGTIHSALAHRLAVGRALSSNQVLTQC
jgi:hypothetical protein